VKEKKENKNKNRIPDSIIIGSAKSGTTSLWHYLNAHPDVFMSTPKEPCYFDESVNWYRGIDWYKSLFECADEGQICGEASTNYTRWPQVNGVPKKIHSLSPNMKLIYVMRNPIARSYSHYIHRWTKEINPGKPFSENFEEFCKKDPMCIDSSLYYEQLEQYLNYFSKEQILTVIFEELVNNPEKVLPEIYDFINIKNKKVELKLSVENMNKEFRTGNAKNSLSIELKKNRVIRVLMNIAPTLLKDFVYNRILLKTKIIKLRNKEFEPQKLNSEQVKKLNLIFKEPNKLLSEKYNIDTEKWW